MLPLYNLRMAVRADTNRLWSANLQLAGKAFTPQTVPCTLLTWRMCCLPRTSRGEEGAGRVGEGEVRSGRAMAATHSELRLSMLVSASRSRVGLRNRRPCRRGDRSGSAAYARSPPQRG